MEDLFWWSRDIQSLYNFGLFLDIWPHKTADTKWCDSWLLENVLTIFLSSKSVLCHSADSSTNQCHCQHYLNASLLFKPSNHSNPVSVAATTDSRNEPRTSWYMGLDTSHSTSSDSTLQSNRLYHFQWTKYVAMRKVWFCLPLISNEHEASLHLNRYKPFDTISYTSWNHSKMGQDGNRANLAPKTKMAIFPLMNLVNYVGIHSGVYKNGDIAYTPYPDYCLPLRFSFLKKNFFKSIHKLVRPRPVVVF